MSLRHPLIQQALTVALTRPPIGYALALIAAISTAFALAG